MLKPVLKPVLKLAWRCWVGRTPGNCCLALLSCCCRQLLAGVHGGAEAGAEASVALKPVLNPLSPNSYRPEAGVTVGIEIDIWGKDRGRIEIEISHPELGFLKLGS